MNAERLLALYDRVADAPDAVPRLRRFILDLAVRGRLVEQDPDDEPASELLKRIAAEKARLVEAGEIKPGRTVKHRDSPPAYFELPKSWNWTQLQAICISVTDGDHLPPPKAESGIPFLVISNVRTQTINYQSERWVPRSYYEALDSSRRPKIGDVLYTLVGSFGIPVEVIDEKEFCVQRHIGIIRPAQCISNRLLVRFMKSKFVFDQADACATGIAQKTVPLSGLRSLLIPLPPLAEQQRIVAKVDELMALCDRLEAARAAREERRDRLAAAGLARLSAPDPDAATFRTHARFAVDTLPALTARADQIARLRQTVLNLAVRGRLVEQDPEDEPASELLKRITADKMKSSGHNDNSPKLDKSELEILPENWSTVALIQLGSWALGSGFPKNEQGATDGPYFFLKVSDMNLPGNEKVIVNANNHIDEAASKRIKARIHPPGTIIFPKIGGAISTNKRRILERPSAIDNNCLGITFSRYVDLEWAYLVLCSLDFTQYQVGSTVPALQQGKLGAIPILLPPLAEQHRIVAKVDELMALCDRLEAGLAAADTARGRLLDSLLHEALDEAA